MNNQASTPRIAAHVVLRQKGKIAFLLRSDTGWQDGNYCLPSGGVEDGETFRQAAIRETQEETGVRIKPEHLKHLLTDHSPDKGGWINVVFEAIEWEGDPHNAEPFMHSTLAWFNPKKLPENVVSFTRTYIECINDGSTYIET